jgi:hypothetical protein
LKWRSPNSKHICAKLQQEPLMLTLPRTSIQF